MSDDVLSRQRRSLEDLDLDDLEDFESEGFTDDQAETDEAAASRGRNAYLNGIWNKYGFSDEKTTQAEKILSAKRMVQTIVNTFSSDGFYRVAFDPNVSTAGTELTKKYVVITPRPLFDKNLTPDQAAIILTGMAAHEISHPRYGRNTATAVRKVFGSKRAPNLLSNLLDDARIERRFAAEYPGYADIFRPMMEYVVRASAEDGDVVPSMANLLNLAVLAVRYPSAAVRWPTAELQGERDWWRAWADRWSVEDAPRRHVEAVREGLRHVLEVKTRRRLEAERAEAKKKEPKERPPSEPVPEDVSRIARDLGALPEDVRKAMRLSAEGKRGPEIAATLGLNERQVKRILRQGRRAVLSSRKGGA